MVVGGGCIVDVLLYQGGCGSSVAKNPSSWRPYNKAASSKKTPKTLTTKDADASLSNFFLRATPKVVNVSPHARLD